MTYGGVETYSQIKHFLLLDWQVFGHFLPEQRPNL